jgi:hypothetical protein
LFSTNVEACCSTTWIGATGRLAMAARDLYVEPEAGESRGFSVKPIGTYF